MKSTKEKRITVRLTPEQYESICEKADTAMMSPSAYMRAAAMPLLCGTGLWWYRGWTS